MNTIARNLLAASLLLVPLAVGEEEVPPAGTEGPVPCGSFYTETSDILSGTVLVLKTWEDGEGGREEAEALIDDEDLSHDLGLLLGTAIQVEGVTHHFPYIECGPCEAPEGCGKVIAVLVSMGDVQYGYHVYEDGTGELTAECLDDFEILMSCSVCIEWI